MPVTVVGTVVQNTPHIVIRCPYCGRIHMHGFTEGPVGDRGHRVSHCLDRNISRDVGYVINWTGVKVRTYPKRFLSLNGVENDHFAKRLEEEGGIVRLARSIGVCEATADRGLSGGGFSSSANFLEFAGRAPDPVHDIMADDSPHFYLQTRAWRLDDTYDKIRAYLRKTGYQPPSDST